MAVCLFLLLICVIVVIGTTAFEQQGYIEKNGKKYRYQTVGYDWEKRKEANTKLVLGEISKEDYLRKDKRGELSVWAYVEVGKLSYTWKDDPVNREVFLMTEDDTATLPQYLQQETGLRTLRQYREAIRK